MSQRGTKAQRDAGYHRRRREDGARDALAGRPRVANDPAYTEAYDRALRDAPAIPDGYRRSDPLERLGALVRAAFGDAEGTACIEASLARIPGEGAHEGVYIAALRAVVVERHPQWAAEHGVVA